MTRHALMLATMIAVAGCASTPRVNYDSDPSANFASYRTYSWVFTGVPQGMNPLMFERVKASIDRSLAARGFTQSTPGDMAVAFTLGRRDRVEVTDYGPYGGFYPGWGMGYRYGWAHPYSSVDVRNVTDGTLAIDIYDARTRKPVWHGTATQQINPDKINASLIDGAVDATLANFPPPPKQ